LLIILIPLIVVNIQNKDKITEVNSDLLNSGEKNMSTEVPQPPPEKKVDELVTYKGPIDDLNYYDYMAENGNVHKLILDEKGEISTYSVNPAGEEVIAYDNEIIPILEQFIKKHPDFSFQGARGIIALTGYSGILGYRTNELTSPNYEKEKNEALQVVNRLKETGWTFASHGYGHLDANKIRYNTLVKDTKRWKEEVASLIGPTPIYIYPYGSSVQEKSDKFTYLQDRGFHIFFSVGPAPYLKINDNYILMDRRHIDGLAFYDQRDRLLDMFDSNEVLDPLRPDN